MKKKQVKLTLKKENVSLLSDVTMDQLRGGNSGNYTAYNCTGGNGGGDGGGNGGGGGNYPTNGCNATQLFTVCFPNTGALATCP